VVVSLDFDLLDIKTRSSSRSRIVSTSIKQDIPHPPDIAPGTPAKMEKFILPAQEIPAVLYRVQHRWYYVPPCGYVTRGVYALNIIEKEPSTLKNLVKEVNNHMWLTIPPRGYVGTIWPSPFVSVYSTWEDAENSLRVRGGKPGDGMWRVFEVSGKKVAATGCKVMRMKDIKGTDDVPESELLIWRFIPEEAFVRTYPWTGPPSKRPV
jgi:hypothetical protein